MFYLNLDQIFITSVEKLCFFLEFFEKSSKDQHLFEI